MISTHSSTATQVQKPGMEKGLFQVAAPGVNSSTPATRSFGSYSTMRSLKTAPGPRFSGRRMLMAFRQQQLPIQLLPVHSRYCSFLEACPWSQGIRSHRCSFQMGQCPRGGHRIRVAAILGNKSPLYRCGSDIHSWAGLGCGSQCAPEWHLQGALPADFRAFCGIYLWLSWDTGGHSAFFLLQA